MMTLDETINNLVQLKNENLKLYEWLEDQWELLDAKPELTKKEIEIILTLEKVLDLLNECEKAIAGGKFKMLAFLEGKKIHLLDAWHTVENGQAAGVSLVNYTVGMLERFCREAQESR